MNLSKKSSLPFICNFLYGIYYHDIKQMSQKYFFLIFGISQSDPAMVFSVDRAKCFRRCRHGVYVHDHGASRGYPRVAELSGAGAG